MIPLMNKKEIRDVRKKLTNYLENVWKNGYNPSLQELRYDLNIRNKELLKRTLRYLRTDQYLDGSYDAEGVYRIYPFKSLSYKSVLYTHLYE